MFQWPFVKKWTYEQVRRENALLREALKQSNEELRKLRLVLGNLSLSAKDELGRVLRENASLRRGKNEGGRFRRDGGTESLPGKSR